MKLMRGTVLPAVVALVLGPLYAGPAAAMMRGTTKDGGAFVTGGVGQNESDRLAGSSRDYSLWVVTAAKGSGAYLASAKVDITDKSGKSVLATTLDGPFLLVNLPPGRYEVATTYGSRTIRRWTNVGHRSHHEMVVYFDVPASTLKTLHKSA